MSVCSKCGITTDQIDGGRGIVLGVTIGDEFVCAKCAGEYCRIHVSQNPPSVDVSYRDDIKSVVIRGGMNDE